MVIRAIGRARLVEKRRLVRKRVGRMREGRAKGVMLIGMRSWGLGGLSR